MDTTSKKRERGQARIRWENAKKSNGKRNLEENAWQNRK